MLIRVITLTAASVLTSIWIGSAEAQRIRPECMTMKDKVGCTCALDNGGGIGRRPGSNRKRWYSKRGTHVNEAFVQCMLRNGRGGSG